MTSIEDRNDMDLTEAEDIKKRWQKYIEKKTKKEIKYLFLKFLIFYYFIF